MYQLWYAYLKTFLLSHSLRGYTTANLKLFLEHEVGEWRTAQRNGVDVVVVVEVDTFVD